MKLPVVESPEKKKRKTKDSPSPPSFSSLPDEITVNYLARIPRPYYPRISIVSKSFHSILSSTELYAARSHLGSTEQCLYVSIWESNRFPQWFTLWINPNRTKKGKKTTGNLLVPIPSSNISNSSVLVVGSEIYFIGGRIDGAPSSAVRILDCRSHTWRDGPSMKVARENAASCFYDGKIYVLGGRKGLEEDEPWADVFDTKTQTWECLPDPSTEVRKCHIFNIEEIKGKICFGNNIEDVNEMYSYDPKQGKWERCKNPSETFFSSECVIEDVSYSCRYDYRTYYGPFRIWWYDIKVGTWKQVKGLESFKEKYWGIRRRGDIGQSKLVNCGGKLLLVWEECMRSIKKISCAEIKVEKRDGGEVWGKVKWDGVVHTNPSSRVLLHCLAVSV